MSSSFPFPFLFFPDRPYLLYAAHPPTLHPVMLASTVSSPDGRPDTSASTDGLCARLPDSLLVTPPGLAWRRPTRARARLAVAELRPGHRPSLLPSPRPPPLPLHAGVMLEPALVPRENEVTTPSMWVGTVRSFWWNLSNLNLEGIFPPDPTQPTQLFIQVRIHLGRNYPEPLRP